MTRASRIALAALVCTLIPTTTAAASERVGTVISAEPLDRKLWIPDTTDQAFRLTYVTTDVRGNRALSTGELFIPKGSAPPGGWPLISWAHGTSGLADGCAPSVMGPAYPERDFPYLSRWMKQGYAVVASDYAGLGTPGLPGYLNGISEAHNVVDMVKAGRQYANQQLLADQQLSDRWVAVGQSQGGGAAIYAARYATAFGGRTLRYLGAVGTGVPAHIEDLLSLAGPGVLPAPTGGHLEVYVATLLASLRAAYPNLGIDGVLTSVGRKWVDLSETVCALPLAEQMKNVAIGSMLSAPLSTLPNWRPTVDAYMKMPESGYDKPFFMGHGALDTDVPYASTAAYVAALKANDQPVTFKTYTADHSGTLLQSQADAAPFVKALFDAAKPGSTPTIKTRLKLVGRPSLRKGIRVRVITNAATPIRLIARNGRIAVGSASATTSKAGTATVTVRFTAPARRRLARLRRATVRITAGETALVVPLGQ